MGGEAFSKALPSLKPGKSASLRPKVRTPRMSPDLYHAQKAHYVGLLKEYLPGAKIVVPAEVPEKADFGDIDIDIYLSSGSPSSHDGKDDSLKFDWVDMARHLRAHAYIKHTSTSYCLAVPYADSETWSDLSVEPIRYIPLNDKKSPTDTPASTSPSRGLSPTPAISERLSTQLDLHIHTDPLLLLWHTFNTSYGDIAGILGQSAHWLGLTVSHTGLYLRSRTLDRIKNDVAYDFDPFPTSSPLNLNNFNIPDASGRIHLSDDPETVMKFFGLDHKMWEAGFKTLEELYAWMGENRFLKSGAWKVRRDKSRTRRRVATRGLFRGFYFEWLPAKLGMKDHEGEGETWEIIIQEDDSPEGLAARQEIERKRIELVDEAVKFFDKEKEHEEMETSLKPRAGNVIVGQWLGAMLTEGMGAGTVPQIAPKGLTEVVRSLRRYIGVREKDRGMEPYIRDEPNTDEESELWVLLDERGWKLRDEEKVKRFAEVNWEEVRSRERERTKAVTGRRRR